ncbi:MAG: SpoVR family protein [Pirellulales bacterium]|nr:SpoVR family protein [Pirellulales bacterium]
MTNHPFSPLPDYLAQVQTQIEGYAAGHGLDFFPTIFEMVDADQLHEVAAYGGFPNRYPHWRFGMEYEQLCKGYTYGLQKIYELVINNNPCYAYLLKSNATTDQKMVMAHVFGHCDFFKNNYWFSQTSRKMMDEMANHANRVRRCQDRVGTSEVEEWIDACLSIEDLIDIHAPFIKRHSDKSPPPTVRAEPAPGDAAEEEYRAGRFAAKDYMDQYINPPEVLKAESDRLRNEREMDRSFPESPVRDVMGFILEHAPLKGWQAEILGIIRDEAYYFSPQAQTKIMNEGWASYWHSTIMTQQGLEPADIINYADHHSGTMASSPTRLNPYKIGIELFRDIEDRWNRGRFGKEFDECDDYERKRRWNTETNLGRQKIFEVRRVHNDLTFIDEFLTLDFCREHKLFSFGYNQDHENYEIESREFPKIKERLLFQLTNLGRPIIQVRDGNYRNRGELYLEHKHCGVDLKISYARDTLANLERLWRRPVHIETIIEDKVTVFSYDGKEHLSEAA